MLQEVNFLHDDRQGHTTAGGQLKGRFCRGQVVADTRLDGCYVRIVKKIEVADTIEYEVVQRLHDRLLNHTQVTQVAEFLLRPLTRREVRVRSRLPRAKGARPRQQSKMRT